MKPRAAIVVLSFLASVVSTSYSIALTGLIRRGANTIRIEVANLALNHAAGCALPD